MRNVNIKSIECYSLWSAAIAGAGVMSLEISGSRLVAPYFGTGVWVWSSLISVTLAGLALGYHRAGKKASEEHAEFLIPRLFFRASLFLLIVISFFHRSLLFLFTYLGYLAGSLGGSALLFFYPMYCLGQVLPYAVRWMRTGNGQAPWRAGRIYSLSTLGSIFGTLLTGLGLAAFLGVGILIVFWIVVFLGISSWGRRLAGKRLSIGSLVLLILVLLHLRVYFSEWPFYPFLAHSSGVYGEIMVFPGDPLIMSVDGLPQTGLPEKLLNEKVSENYFYEQRYFLPLLKHIHPDGKEALIVGLGGGLMEKVFDSLGVTSEFVEINPKVIEYAREYFNVTSPVHLSDGRWFIRKTQKKYDFIVLDVYQSDQLGWHMLTREALELAKKRLKTGGVLTVHLLSFPKPGLINNSIIRTLRKSFPYVEVIAAYPEDQEQLQSLLFFASQRSISLPENVPGIRELDPFRLHLPDRKGVLLADGYFPLELSWATIAQEWRQAFRADKLGVYNSGLIGMAIGGFMEAQIRSKVHRANVNMKELSQHFLLFKKHYGRLPDNEEEFKGVERYYEGQGQANMIRTIHELMRDPFGEQGQVLFYRLFTVAPNELGIIGSVGPDQDIDIPAQLATPDIKATYETSWHLLTDQKTEKHQCIIEIIYDPTNGTVSDGDIIWLIAD